MNHVVTGLWWHEGKEIPRTFFHGQPRRGWSYESLNGDLEIKDQSIVGGCLLDAESHRWEVKGSLIINEIKGKKKGVLHFSATFHDRFVNERFTIQAQLIENRGLWKGTFKFEAAHGPQPPGNVTNALLIAFPPISLA